MPGDFPIPPITRTPQPLAGQDSPSTGPLKSIVTPLLTDFILVETINRKSGDFQEKLPGTPHPDYSAYPNHVLLAQLPVDWEHDKRIWGRADTAPDVYNYAVKYSADSATHPLHIRQYRERRDTYSRRANGSALQVVYRVTITNGGTGYVQASPPAVTFSGGAGSGAAATAIVNSSGVVVAVSLTASGSGYTSAPSVAIAAPTSGTTATATAYIQEVSGMVLVSEEMQPLPADDPMSGVFVSVMRAYQTMPGPWIYSTRLDPDGAVVTVATRKNIAASITSSEALAGGTWTKTTKRGEQSSYVADEVVETRAIPGTDRISKRFNRFGGLDLIKQKFVDGTTTPTNSTYTVQELQAETALVASLIETIIATGSVITTIDNIDPTIPGSRATVSYSLVLASAAVPDDSPSTRTIYETLEFPENPLLRILKTTTFSIPNYTSGSPLVEYEDGSYSFPALIYSVVDDDSGTTRDARMGFSVPVVFRKESYFTTTPQVIDPYQIIPCNHVVYSMAIAGLIDNGDTFAKTGYSTITIVGSSPGANQLLRRCSPQRSTYEGLISTSWNDAVTVAGPSVLWRCGIYKTSVMKVRLQ